MRHFLDADATSVESTISESNAKVASSLIKKAAELEAHPVPLEVTDLRTAFASGGARATIRLATLRTLVEVVGRAAVKPARTENNKADRMVQILRE